MPAAGFAFGDLNFDKLVFLASYSELCGGIDGENAVARFDALDKMSLALILACVNKVKASHIDYYYDSRQLSNTSN